MLHNNSSQQQEASEALSAVLLTYVNLSGTLDQAKSKPRILPQLAQLLNPATQQPVSTRTLICRLLHNFALAAENSNEIRQNGFLELLSATQGGVLDQLDGLGHLSHDEAGLLQAAAGAIWALTNDECNCSEFVRIGVGDQMVMVMKDARLSEEIKRRAAGVLWNIALDDRL